MNVAYVGLGSMGAPQARLIARSGGDLAVYDAYPDALKKFEGTARLAGSPADAARGADFACVCVRDDRQVLDVVLGRGGLAEGLAPGALLLIHSTIRIDTLFHLHDRLAPRGIALVDAPVSRTRRTDDEPFVVTMLGGAADDLPRARKVVECFSTEIEEMGPLGAGMATKIANNLTTWVHLVVASKAFDLAGRYGVTVERLSAVMKANGNLTPTVSAFADGKRQFRPGMNPDYDAFIASQAGIGEKDLALAIESGNAVGLDMEMIEKAQTQIRAMMTGPLGLVPEALI